MSKVSRVAYEPQVRRVARQGSPEHNMAAFMQRAIALARRGEGQTMPNPPVGAVIVRNGSVVGEGFHKKAGGPHAEIHALNAAGKRARGADLYVTLEPCCTRGRTGPCTSAIISSGIRRVIAAIRDPNPEHRGRGLEVLRKAGIKVIENVCREEASELIRPFATWITTGRPFVTLKLGISIDGRIGDRHRKSRWITSPASRRAVMALRRRSDAILVGSKTAAEDDPALLCGRKIEPYRVIADSRGTLPATARVLNDATTPRTIIATTARCPAAKAAAYRRKGAQVMILPESRGLISLQALLRRLGGMGLLHLLCEGGGELAQSLIRQKCVHEFIFFIAPAIIGGTGSVPAVGGEGWVLQKCPRLKFTRHVKSGADIMVCAVPR